MLKMDVIIKAMVPHQAQILGGLKGSHRLVSNIHTIEDKETASFIKDHELIFMTGVALSGTDMLEELIINITEKNIAGIIINTGFYISKIPQSIITLCDQKSIPLLVLPWKYVLSDLQKTIFRELYSKQYKDEYVSQILEKIIHRLHTNKSKSTDIFQINTTERYCVAILDYPSTIGNIAKLESHLKSMPFVAHVFEEKMIANRIVIIFMQDQCQSLIYHEKNLQKWLDLYPLTEYKLGIGQPCTSWKTLPTSYEEAELAISTATELSYAEPFIISFQNISLLKIIQNVSDKDLLKKFVDQTLGKLEHYDDKDQVNTLQFLQVWIKHSGKTQAIADELFIHRNTVSYRINKIKSILGCTELTYPIISNLFFALLIRNTMHAED